MSQLIVERQDGTRRVSLVFDEKAKVVKRLSSDKRGKVSEYYPEKSRTKPEFHRESQINVIIAKYRKTKIWGDPMRGQGIEGDFSDIGDFSELMRRVADVKSRFEGLPADIRKKFGHNVENYVDYMLDDSNIDEAHELGLKVKIFKDPKAEPEAVNPSASETPEAMPKEGTPVPPAVNPGQGA